MTPAQKRLRELRDRQSKERQRMAELSLLDKLDTETRAELDGIEKSTPDLERQLRAAAVAAEAEDRSSMIDTGTGQTEDKDRVELRNAASVGRFLVGAGGRQSGAEAELQQELGLNAQQIPLEMWQRPETRAAEPEKRAVTAAPSTVGINLDTLRPMVFAPSVVDKLMIEMPQVESGTFATGTIDMAATLLFARVGVAAGLGGELDLLPAGCLGRSSQRCSGLRGGEDGGMHERSAAPNVKRSPRLGTRPRSARVCAGQRPANVK